jgi:hypothetical protein
MGVSIDNDPSMLTPTLDETNYFLILYHIFSFSFKNIIETTDKSDKKDKAKGIPSLLSLTSVVNFLECMVGNFLRNDFYDDHNPTQDCLHRRRQP